MQNSFPPQVSDECIVASGNIALVTKGYMKRGPLTLCLAYLQLIRDLRVLSGNNANINEARCGAGEYLTVRDDFYKSLVLEVWREGDIFDIAPVMQGKISRYARRVR